MGHPELMNLPCYLVEDEKQRGKRNWIRGLESGANKKQKHKQKQVIKIEVKKSRHIKGIGKGQRVPT